ncbi:MAG: hypothetical protein AAB932_02695 [Patescibacteria group bacterium]
MQEQNTLQDILSIVEFIRDNASTKDDLRAVEQRLDKKIDSIKNEMIGHVDAFVGLYQKHEQELAAVVSRQNRLEEKLNLILKHLNLGTV